MKKNILLKNGWKLTACDEDFLNLYRGLAIRVFMKYNMNKGSKTQITEDEKQELDIVIYKVFLKYDENKKTKNGEPIMFSTLLTWWLKSHCTHKISNVLNKKRDTDNLTFINVDDSYGDGKHTLSEMVGDDKVEIESTYSDKDFINHINKYLANDEEKQVFSFIMGEIKGTKLAEKLDISRQKLNYKRNKLLAKLEVATAEYNGYRSKFDSVKKKKSNNKIEVIEGQMSLF